jgi:hypothetical protein
MSSAKRVEVVTAFVHESGEWFASVLGADIGDTKPQAIGSAITYLRRYQVQSLAGVAAEKDDDDHGAQHEPEQTRVQARKTKTKDPEPSGIDAPSVQERKDLIARARELGWTDDAFKTVMREQHGVERTHDLTRVQFAAMSDTVESGVISDASADEAEQEPF